MINRQFKINNIKNSILFLRNRRLNLLIKQTKLKLQNKLKNKLFNLTLTVMKLIRRSLVGLTFPALNVTMCGKNSNFRTEKLFNKT